MKLKAFEKHKIPYKPEYTDKIVRSIAKIAETKPYLRKHIGTKLGIELLRGVRIQAITYSNQIEGNQLTVEQVTAVLGGQKIKGKSKDVKEIQNYHEAINYIERVSQDSSGIRPNDFYDVHQLVVKDVLQKKDSGCLRQVPVSIMNPASGDVIEECPEPHFLSDLMEDLWSWLDQTKQLDPFLRAFSFHFLIVAIHPFVDGNGRTARLMQHLLLLKSGEDIARLIPSETVIVENKQNYYQALRHTRSLLSLRPITEYLSDCFVGASQKVLAEGDAILNSTLKDRDSRRLYLMELAQGFDAFSIGDVINHFPGVSRRTVERDLVFLVENKQLLAKGINKGRVYEKI